MKASAKASKDSAGLTIPAREGLSSIPSSAAEPHSLQNEVRPRSLLKVFCSAYCSSMRRAGSLSKNT